MLIDGIIHNEMLKGRAFYGLSALLIVVIMFVLATRHTQTYVMEENIPDISPPASNKNVQSSSNTDLKVCKVDFTNAYSMDLTKWAKNEHVCDNCEKFDKANLRTPYGNTPIFVYPSAQDPWVSGILMSSGNFEAEKSNIMFHLLKQDPKANLIDIGANIGVYTLSAAKMGRKVIAVEALDRNVKHICASVAAGGLQDKVTLVHNAIADSNGVVNLGVDKNNMGGTFVDVDSKHIKELKLGRAQGTYGQVHTIKMDDLLKLPAMENFQTVVVKMDIEGFEAKAMAGASAFFDKLKILGFLMEWEFHKGQKTAESIIKFMKDKKFSPYALSINKKPLALDKSDSWGYDVLWLPDS